MIDCRYVIKQVATGLNRMHTLGLVHMDIKPENILITEQGVLKIGDLGMAQYVNTDEDGLEGDARYVKSLLYRLVVLVVYLPVPHSEKSCPDHFDC